MNGWVSRSSKQDNDSVFLIGVRWLKSVKVIGVSSSFAENGSTAKIVFTIQ
jgi:hypothetical protein